MSMTVTLALIAAFLAAGVFCGWRGSLPPTFKNGPRMIPWRPLMVVNALIVVVLMAHVGGLLGVGGTR